MNKVTKIKSYVLRLFAVALVSGAVTSVALDAQNQPKPQSATTEKQGSLVLSLVSSAIKDIKTRMWSWAFNRLDGLIGERATIESKVFVAAVATTVVAYGTWRAYKAIKSRVQGSSNGAGQIGPYHIEDIV